MYDINFLAVSMAEDVGLQLYNLNIAKLKVNFSDFLP